MGGSFKMERIILFGAGASYGAGHILPKAPPLGKDLYAELTRYYLPSWGSLPKEIKASFGDGFEQGMQVLWDKYSSNIALFMRHMTLYLAQFRPDDSQQDLYSRLLQQLKTKRILLSTLNYECILELAASTLGYKIDYSGGEVASDAMQIMKLHGSCNFLPSSIQAKGITFTSEVVFDGDLQSVNPNEAIQYCLSNTALYPAMALYMNAKPIQIGQSVIHGLQLRWGDRVRKAKKILVIGARPYHEDTHIWEPLAECNGELGFIGPKQVFNEWREKYRSNKSSLWIGSRWHTCFSESASFILEEI
jgi:hypothetical protein